MCCNCNNSSCWDNNVCYIPCYIFIEPCCDDDFDSDCCERRRHRKHRRRDRRCRRRDDINVMNGCLAKRKGI